MPRPTVDVTKVTTAAFDYTVPTYWKNAGGSNIDGGSWWDSTASANGSSFWASQTVSAAQQYNFDVTTLFQKIYDNPNWCSAVILGATGSGICTFVGNTGTSGQRPLINYDGGSDQSIVNEVAIGNASGSSGLVNQANQYVNPDLGTSVSLYERWILVVSPPATRPTSATLKLWSSYASGTTVGVMWLRYPPESAPNLSSPIYEFASFNRGVGRGIARGIA
jgi:hypothetical protein